MSGVILVCVFKQKTAYEMRISDWSSDVCSSDLCAGSDRADGNPFLSHAFLHALEESGSVGAEAGWQPQHLLMTDKAGRLVGAAPMYLKGQDRKRVVSGKSVSVRVDLGGRRIIKKKKYKNKCTYAQSTERT